MRHRPIRRTVSKIVAVALLVSACGVAGTTSPPGPSTRPAESAAAAPTPAGATAAAPASTPAGATATADPPQASLAAEGGDPVVGQLGSYTWLDGGSDSPWLPGSPVSVGASEPLTVTIGDGIAVAAWSARRIPAGKTDATGALALGSGGPPVAFASPGPGTWSIQVSVRFGGDLGEATYYWQLTVR